MGGGGGGIPKTSLDGALNPVPIFRIIAWFDSKTRIANIIGSPKLGSQLDYDMFVIVLIFHLFVCLFCCLPL